MWWFYLRTVGDDCFLLNGKKEILFPFTKRATNKILKIIDQFLYFQFVVKYLKDLFLMKYLSISPLINSSLKTSLVFNAVIPASTNCYQLPTKFLYLLITDSKLEAFFYTYLKLLIKSGMKGLFSNWNKMAFLVNFFTFWPIF